MKLSTTPTLKTPPRGAWHAALLLVPVVLFVIVAAYGLLRAVPYLDAQVRLHQIKTIYSSLRLDSTYLPRTTNIFGDKRYYVGDRTRTHASSVTFIRAATVSQTAVDLKARVEAAGFAYVEDAYPGGAAVEYHFRDRVGEYVRVNVSSKPRDDVIQNKFLMQQSVTAQDYAMDVNAGPANVTIKVNLDDNDD